MWGCVPLIMLIIQILRTGRDPEKWRSLFRWNAKCLNRWIMAFTLMTDTKEKVWVCILTDHTKQRSGKLRKYGITPGWSSERNCRMYYQRDCDVKTQTIFFLLEILDRELRPPIFLQKWLLEFAKDMRVYSIFKGSDAWNVPSNIDSK